MAEGGQNEFKDYFQRDLVNNSTKCLIADCNKLYSGYVSTNLWRHLHSAHTDVYDQLKPEKKNRRKRETHDDAIQEIRKGLVELSTVNGKEFSLVNASGFQRILKTLTTRNVSSNCNNDEDESSSSSNGKLSVSDFNHKNLSADIKEAYRQVKEVIAAEVKGKLISVMVDICTKHRKAILGVLIQYVVHGKIILRTLGMVRMKHPHTGLYISELIIKKLAEYGISVEQIYTVTSDNASNMTKAVFDLNSEIQKEAGIDDVAGAELLNDEDLIGLITSDEEHAEDIEGSEPETEAEYVNMMDSFVNIFLDRGLHRVYGLPCAAHSLQIEVNKSIDAWQMETGLLSKVRDIVTKLRNQNIVDEISNKGLKTPVLDCKTRWHSIYLMVSRHSLTLEIIHIWNDFILK